MTHKKRLRNQKKQVQQSDDTDQKKTTMDELKKHLHDQLYNNDMIRKAKESMTPEQLENYKKKGESFFADVNFEEKNGNEIPPVESSCAYITEGLKSGLHPSYLQEDEQNVMVEIYGKEWYKKWGYNSISL